MYIRGNLDLNLKVPTYSRMVVSAAWQLPKENPTTKLIGFDFGWRIWSLFAVVWKEKARPPLRRAGKFRSATRVAHPNRLAVSGRCPSHRCRRRRRHHHRYLQNFDFSGASTCPAPNFNVPLIIASRASVICLGWTPLATRTSCDDVSTPVAFTACFFTHLSYLFFQNFCWCLLT